MVDWPYVLAQIAFRLIIIIAISAGFKEGYEEYKKKSSKKM